MKNILLTTFIFFLLIFQINAQQIALLEEPEENIPLAALNWENQKLRSDLTLNDAQFEKIKSINLERLKARKMVERMFKYEDKKREAKLREMDRQFDNEFAEVLNKKQFKKYLALQGRTESDPASEIIYQPEPNEPNFNARIQQLISQATAPVVNNELLPQQDTTSLEFSLQPDSSINNLTLVTEPDSLNLLTSSEDQTQGKSKLKVDGKHNSLKMENAGGKLKLEDGEEKAKTKDNIKYKAEADEAEDKLKTPEKTVKYKEGREKMEPEK